jgi:hypothetical protein
MPAMMTCKEQQLCSLLNTLRLQGSPSNLTIPGVMSSLAAANIDLMLCKVQKSRLRKMERVFEKHYNNLEDNRCGWE